MILSKEEMEIAVQSVQPKVTSSLFIRALSNLLFQQYIVRVILKFDKGAGRGAEICCLWPRTPPLPWKILKIQTL